jgi:MFS family permease
MSDMPPSPAEAGPQKVQLSHRQILLIFSGLMLGMFLAALDQTIVSAALPTIAADLGGFDKLVWVVTSYLLTSTITILMWGKLSDIYGRKVMFQLSIATFLVSSALIGLSPNMLFLVIGRGLQGIGAGGIMSLTFAIVGDILSPRERGKYMGLLGSVFLVSSVVGPLLGGLIVDHLHIFGVAPWRWIFYVNLPIGIPALILTQVVLKLPFARQKQSIDYLGAALVSIAASLLILALIWGGAASAWDSSYNLRWFPGVGEASNVPGAVLDAGQQFLGDWLVTLMLATGILVGGIFVFAETRVENPLLPMSLFRNGVFTISSLVSFVIGAAMFGGFVFLPTYLQISTGVSATYSGLLLLPLIGGLMPMSTASGIIISKTGRYKWWPMVGLPVAAIGMAMLSQLTPDTAKWYVSLGMFLLGAGIGMTMQVMVLAVQNSLPMRQMGVGTAANNFMRSMGSVIGVSLFGVLFNNEIRAALKELAAAGNDPRVVGGILQSSPGKIQELPSGIKDVVTSHVATGVAHIFLYAIPMVLVAFVLLLFLKEVPLRSTRNIGAKEQDTIVAASAGETAPVAPTPPVLPGATAASRTVSTSPADLRAAPRPQTLAEIQRAVDQMTVRQRASPAPARRR